MMEIDILRHVEATRKRVASTTRELRCTERALQYEEALMTLQVCGELDQGKPKYANDLVRKAEITRRLFLHTVWQDLVQHRDALEEAIASLGAEITYIDMEVAYGQSQQV